MGSEGARPWNNRRSRLRSPGFSGCAQCSGPILSEDSPGRSMKRVKGVWWTTRTTPRISFVVPAFNSGQTIEQTLRSVTMDNLTESR